MGRSSKEKGEQTHCNIDGKKSIEKKQQIKSTPFLV